ncbi:MAG: YciI family protein [Trueperaceae bacterium]
MLYLVIAKDALDAEAPHRRQRVRPAHLADLTPLAEDGTVKLAGAILTDDGAAIGSALLVEADSESTVRSLLEGDVYSREGVWSTFEVYPFKQAF